MINYNKNKLINETLVKYYETFEHTLDTVDFVPQKYNTKICKYIFKNLKTTFKKIDREDKKYQKEFNKKIKDKEKVKKGKEEKPKKRHKILDLFKKLFKKKGQRTAKDADSNNNS